MNLIGGIREIFSNLQKHDINISELSPVDKLYFFTKLVHLLHKSFFEQSIFIFCCIIDPCDISCDIFNIALTIN